MSSTFARSPVARRRFPLAIALAFGALAAGSTRLPAEPDPLEGRWLGIAGAPRERVEVGLEFRRGDDGALVVSITLPVANYAGFEWPGAVVREGERVRHDELELDLVLRGDRLTGTFGGPQSAAAFERSDRLPSETPAPPVPPLPEPRWQKRIGGQVYASPTVFDGHVYVGTTGGVFAAFRAADGRFVWAFPAGRPIYGGALATDDAVYFVCDDGHLYKLRRADGTEVWRYDLGDARAPRVLPHPAVFDWDWQGVRPVLADGVVYAGAGDGGFHAVDAATGARRWRVATGGKIRNAAAIDGARVVVGSEDKLVYALDRASGALVWKHDTGAPVDTAPVVHAGSVLVGNRGRGLLALDAATGAERWRTTFWGSWLESTPVVVDGVVYVGSSDLTRVSALDPGDGRVLWRTDVDGWSFGTPLVVGDRVYAGAAGGAPYFLPHVAGFAELDRATGRLLRRRPLPEVAGAHQWGIAGSPALAGDLVVVTTIEGGLAAYPIR